MWTDQIALLGAGLGSPGPWRAFADYTDPVVVVSNSAGVTLEVSNDRLEITNIEQLVAALADGAHQLEPGYRWIRATGDGECILSGKVLSNN